MTKILEIFNCKNKTDRQILALGAESSGNFSFFSAGRIYYSPGFGDLLEENNFNRFKKAVLDFIKAENAAPNIILSDMHPLMRTTLMGEKLSKKYKARHILIQHHHAHIFSAIGDKIIGGSWQGIPHEFYGIAMDGTGYGDNGNIWGGEVFKISRSGIRDQKQTQNSNNQILKQTLSIKRIGHLENQVMIGGDLAIQEPARMLIATLDKFPISNFQFPNFKNKKTFIYNFIKKHYLKKEFEVLYNQLQQGFNCVETSSTGRILDAVSLLLGFCKNERNHKHQATYLLEKNSTKPYAELKPAIAKDDSKFILQTTPLFEYLIKNISRDRFRLAATAQCYIARGMLEIIKLNSKSLKNATQIFISGGISNNKIIFRYLESRGAYANKKIPRGDEGLSFGQVIYYLLSV